MDVTLAIHVLESRLEILNEQYFLGSEEWVKSIRTAIAILKEHKQRESYEDIFFRETLSKL